MWYAVGVCPKSHCGAFCGGLEHSKMLKSIQSCLFFFCRTHKVFALALADVVIVALCQTALVFCLCDIQSRNLETVFLQNVILDFGISCGRSCGLWKVSNIHLKVDMFIDLLPT